ncbi:hypothetical protein HKX40_02035 [Pelistega europaea]|uniref:Uncharacterized protein n=2 Tax=Pelistega europaea TaxID=106147 RepID=A0A7Y4L8N4_9BURK|nr:hypothetical protein [Pelistega europaea]
MRNSFLRKGYVFSVFFILMSNSFIAYAQDIPLEPGYTAYDKHKAVNTCMQYLYVTRFKEIPADENMFPLCEQRFLALSRKLSHEQFIKERAESSPHQQQHTFNTYYDTLFGIPPADLSLPSTPENTP